MSASNAAFLATLIRQGAPKYWFEKCCGEIETRDVFEAHRQGELSAEEGALILYHHRRSKTPWLIRIWEALWH